MKDLAPESWQDKFNKAEAGNEKIYTMTSTLFYKNALQAVLQRNLLQIDLFLITRSKKHISIKCIVKNNHKEYKKQIEELSGIMDLTARGVPEAVLDNNSVTRTMTLDSYLLRKDALPSMFQYVITNVKAIFSDDEFEEKITKPLVEATLYFAQIKTK